MFFDKIMIYHKIDYNELAFKYQQRNKPESK